MFWDMIEKAAAIIALLGAGLFIYKLWKYRGLKSDTELIGQTAACAEATDSKIDRLHEKLDRVLEQSQSQHSVGFYLDGIAQSDAGDLFEAGVDALIEKKWDKAITAFEGSLAKAENDTRRAVIHNLIGFAYYEKQDWEQARGAYADGLKFAKLAGEKAAVLDALNGLGLALMDLGKYKEAKDQFDVGMSLLCEVEDEGYRGAFLGNLGLVYMDTGNCDAAEKAHQEALEIHRRLGNPLGVAQDLGNLGNVYIQKRKYAAAKKHFEESLEIHSSLGNPLGEAQNLCNLSLVYKNNGDYGAAEKYLKESLEIARRLGHPLGEAQVLGNLGLVYRRLGDYPAAEKTHQEALEIDRRLGHPLGVAVDLCNLGFLAGHLERYEAAYMYHKRSLDIFEKIDAIPTDATNVRNSLENCVNKLKAKGVDPDSLPPLDLDNLPRIVLEDDSTPPTE